MASRTHFLPFRRLYRSLILSGCLYSLLVATPQIGLSQDAAKPAPRPAYAASTSKSGFYSIAGTLLNAVTGEPLARATVAVLSSGDSRIVQSVDSASDGHFALQGLPAAKYQLTASKRGFLTAFYDQHEEFSSAIVTGEDQDTNNLTFQLMPGAVLHGVVTGDGGDPVESAQVLLFRKAPGSRASARIVHTETVLTDDTGTYEFSKLEPGVYLLAVEARPWYALNRSTSQNRATGSVNIELDVAYPVTYFDSTTDEATASPLILTEGTHTEANINLHAVPALNLAVEIPRRQNGMAQPQLRQSIFGEPVSTINAGFEPASQTGKIEFFGVAPGHYELEQGDPPRVVELEATASQSVDPNLGTPMVPVTADLRTLSGAPLTSPDIQQLAFESLEHPRRFVQVQASSPGDGPRSASLPLGQWKLWAQGENHPWHILSVTANGKTQAGNLVTAHDHPLSLLVTVSESATRIEGFARKDGKGLAGAMIVLVPRPAPTLDRPESGIRNEPVRDVTLLETLARRDQSDSDGSFALLDVVPGAYTIVAIEDGWSLDWSNPAVISRYLAKGVSVVVTENSGQLLRIAEPVPVEMR